MTQASSSLPDPVNPHYAYTGAFVDELQRAGVRHVIICPGSRSTPLAMAFAAHTAMRVWMHVDERSAAYFGLGMAKQLRQPVALLCTSGTAAANFLPAIIEAKLTCIPLLVLTADRPHELRDNGAPQSIDQNRLYGTHVKWFVEAALPEATDAALRYIRTIAARATALAQAIPAGPVHLNFPFREPLTPEALPGQPLPQAAQRDPVAWQGRPDNRPYVEVRNRPAGAPAAATVEYLEGMVRGARRGLIVAGPIDAPALAEPLARLAQRLGYPVLADPLSQLRCGDHDQSMMLSAYDAFLRHDSFVESAQPELVLRFGAMPISKPVLLYLKRYASCPLVVIDGHEGWEEPTQLASDLIHADPTALCQALLNALDAGASAASGVVGGPRRVERVSIPTRQAPIDRPASPSPSPSRTWATMWQDADSVTRQALQAAILEFDELFEGRVFSELAHLLPGGTTLYVGNSMPVRDLDTFFSCTGEDIRIMGNRGASGIDGVVSSALGASAGAGQHTPTMLVLGDLSFFHDLNGLLAARLYGLNLTIVLINNDGGGIFSFLPQADYPEHFEQLFGTPTGLDFGPAVQMYGGQYHRADGWEQFRKLVSQGLDSGGLQVIEVPTERESNVNMHRHLWKVVGEALNKEGEGT
jgi:2-succinyl-5-enolpyruvyl-6-hydroxy-3-cyclohexene-1-carboxylate synthase